MLRKTATRTGMQVWRGGPGKIHESWFFPTCLRPMEDMLGCRDMHACMQAWVRLSKWVSTDVTSTNRPFLPPGSPAHRLQLLWQRRCRSLLTPSLPLNPRLNPLNLVV